MKYLNIIKTFSLSVFLLRLSGDCICKPEDKVGEPKYAVYRKLCKNNFRYAILSGMCSMDGAKSVESATSGCTRGLKGERCFLCSFFSIISSSIIPSKCALQVSIIKILHWWQFCHNGNEYFLCLILILNMMSNKLYLSHLT